MSKKVPNIQRIINNDILKIVNMVFSGGGAVPSPPPLALRLCTALLRIVLQRSRRETSARKSVDYFVKHGKMLLSRLRVENDIIDVTTSFVKIIQSLPNTSLQSRTRVYHAKRHFYKLI